MDSGSRNSFVEVAASLSGPARLADERIPASQRPSFREALRFWFKLGWISFGGTAAHIAIMHDELVEKKRWIGNGRFLHALESCEARISSRPTSCSLKRGSFWGAKSRFPDLVETLVVGSNRWSGWNRVRRFASRGSPVRSRSRPPTFSLIAKHLADSSLLQFLRLGPVTVHELCTNGVIVR